MCFSHTFVQEEEAFVWGELVPYFLHFLLSSLSCSAHKRTSKEQEAKRSLTVTTAHGTQQVSGEGST